MAYTSTLALALSAAANEQLKARLATLPKERRTLLKSADDRRSKKGAHLYYWNCLRERETRFLGSFVDSLPASEFHLCRVGDDPDDNEEAGMLEDPFDLRLRREVTVG